MSRVYFHSPSETAELRGAERAWASGIVEDMAVGIVTPRFGEQRDRMLGLIPQDHYLRAVPVDSPSWERSFQTAWRVQLDLEWRGKTLDAWTFSLNTALVLGNDQVRFLARLHAQCEIHGWVDARNRAWLASLIEDGRALGFYRPDMGWEAVVEMLRRRDDEPVVMSYSVTESFPNAYASDWMPTWPEGVPERFDALTEAQQREREERSESWYDLDATERWERGMRWLRAQPGMGEMRPADWSDFRFGHGLTAFDLLASDRDERLDRALGLVRT